MFGDGVTVSIHYKFVPAKDGNQDEQRAFREMKIRQQCINSLKSVPRNDGQTGGVATREKAVKFNEV